MVYKLFDKKTQSGESVKEELTQKLSKPVIEKFKRERVVVRFKNNIQVTNLAEVRSQPCKSSRDKNLLCAIDVFTKCAWIKQLKDKKTKTVLIK